MCDACLVFIDKCPVCRAAFEEYIVIKHDDDDDDNLEAEEEAAAAAGQSLQQQQQSRTAINGGINIFGVDVNSTTVSI